MKNHSVIHKESLQDSTHPRDPSREATNLLSWKEARDTIYPRHQGEDFFLLSAILQTSSDALIAFTLDGEIIRWSAAAESLWGYSSDESIGRNIHLLLSPKYRDSLRQVFQEVRTGQSFTLVQCLCERKGGGQLTVQIRGCPIRDSEGTVTGVCAVFRDISEQQQLEARLQKLSGKMINILEQERSRIARELHDDINQNLALLSIEMQQLSQSLPIKEPMIRTRLQDLWKRTQDLSLDIHHLSHQLHPSKLDYLGLVAAVKGFCVEFSERRGLVINFSHRHMPKHLPADTALCLFRIVQEAVQNVAKHSGAQKADVLLVGTPKAIYLSITDKGAGFHVESSKSKGGLGLLSMMERLRPIEGSISICSEPSVGTEINVSVPLKKGSSKKVAGDRPGSRKFRR